MQIASATAQKMPHLNPKYLEDVQKSCITKCTKSQYEYMLDRIENEVSIVIRAMSNSADSGYGFLKLAIHPGSNPSSMAIIYEKVLNQTPWKYRKTALSFIESIDTLFKFANKNTEVFIKLQPDSQAIENKENFLAALSELTIMYVARLVNQEKTPLAS